MKIIVHVDAFPEGQTDLIHKPGQKWLHYELVSVSRPDLYSASKIGGIVVGYTEFKSVPDGDYILTVTKSDHKGVVSGDSISAQFTITKPVIDESIHKVHLVFPNLNSH